MPNILEGRRAVVFGVANKRSIAWAIAQQMQQAGAQLAITYQNDRLKQEADELIAALPNAQAFQCDVLLPPVENSGRLGKQWLEYSCSAGPWLP